MTFNPPNILEVTKIISQLNYLFILLDEENSELRWNVLQSWLEKNPQYREILETAVNLPPEEALIYVLDQLGIDQNLIRTYDPLGIVKKRAEGAICKIQTLYKNRQAIDSPALPEPEPKKIKGKKKTSKPKTKKEKTNATLEKNRKKRV